MFPTLSNEKISIKLYFPFLLSMQRLSYADVLALTKASPATALLIDVRNEGECAEGMIPTAINIPLPTLSEAVKKNAEEFEAAYGVPKPSLEDRLVVYCLRGGRAEQGVAALTASGFKNVDIYPGSWMDWSAQQKS